MTYLSTESQKLVRYRLEDCTSESESSFIIPKKARTRLKNTLPDDDTPIEIDYNPSNAFFRFGQIHLICRLIDEKYPDYEAVIPTNNQNKLNLDRSQFLTSLKRVVIYSNKTHKQIPMQVSDGQLTKQKNDV